ncbi:unnamed protein product [Urochloa decumbens]|uniref:RING-type E3 ubiquitin transferase n=1 Tax=Urochloa decumbens TaxID=240449 RepID=A0ABC9A560_9POAL
MPTLLSARSRHNRAGAGAGDDEGGAGVGNRACYGIAACAVSVLLFCALAASVSVWIAFAFGALALVAFGVAGCLAPASWRVVGPSDNGGAIAGSEAAADAAGAAARARRRFGMPKAAIDALPTFAYEHSAAEDAAAAAGGDLESGAASSGEQCPVCLEDVDAGEMVRQLPACKHLFHVECIDMWLQSHRTCPVCRCNIMRSQRKVAAVKAAAPDAAAAAAAEEDLPAEDALPPV